jgi:polyphosphate kinase
MPASVRDLLAKNLELAPFQVYAIDGPMGLASLLELNEIERPDLKFRPFLPAVPPVILPDETLFDTIRRRDVLLYHPYDSFSTVVDFLREAAEDPRVLAIKQTLYRTSGDSPIIDALVDAAESGKQVLVIVEIKARFDEVANIRWARKLEQAGCHVVYGLVGLKTHCKLSMVVRDEPEGIRRYTHIGTGNYNSKTARLYEDLGLITTDEAIGEDVAHLFNNLSGYSRNASYEQLLVAPDSVRSGLLDAIHREIGHHRAGRPAQIRIKANSIVDEAVVDALYLASQAGVPVQLLVRGICALRPGVPGLSDSIEVRSILGRFLEHSRIYWFANGGEHVAWIGSADMMHRNLDRRVEVLVRLPADESVREVEYLLDLAFEPTTAAWELGPEGAWQRNQGHVDLQATLIDRQRRRRPGAEQRP